MLIFTGALTPATAAGVGGGMQGEVWGHKQRADKLQARLDTFAHELWQVSDCLTACCADHSKGQERVCDRTHSGCSEMTNHAHNRTCKAGDFACKTCLRYKPCTGSRQPGQGAMHQGQLIGGAYIQCILPTADLCAACTLQLYTPAPTCSYPRASCCPYLCACHL
jgi:hypothetical protein